MRHDGLTGTADLIVRCADGVTLLIDWKTGRRHLGKAADNYQLMGYAFLSWAVLHLGDGDRLIVHLFSATDDADNRFTASEYTQEHMGDIAAMVVRAEEACEEPDAKRSPNPIACFYCRARGRLDVCPESLATESVPVLTSAPLPPELAGKVRGYYDMARAQEKALEGFFGWLRGVLEADPDAVPGMGLKDGIMRREVTDAQALCQLGVDSGWWTEDTFMPIVKVSAADAEKLAKDAIRASGAKAKDVKELFNAAVTDAGCMEVKQGARRIVVVD